MVFLVIALLGLYTSKVNALTASGSGLLKQNRITQQLTTIKGKADQEVDRRVTSINTIITRINAMKKLSDSQKAGLVAQANQLSADLGTLKNKIDADTDTASLKTDRMSIYTSYRVYMLFMPRMNILAAADRIAEVADQARGLVPTIQAKITQLSGNGKDVTALNGALADLQSKLNDATDKAQQAVNLVSSLVPDQGNTATTQANKTAINSARDMIKVAITDVKAARIDIKTIRTGLHGILTKPKTTPEPTSTP